MMDFFIFTFIQILMKKYFLLLFLFTNLSFAQNDLSSTDKISAWTKTWGFLKFFHPTVTHGTIDWDSVFVSQLDSLQNIKTKEQLNVHFIDLINDLNKQTELNRNSKDAMFIENILSDFDDKGLFSDELNEAFRNVALQRISGENRFIAFDKESNYPLFLENNNETSLPTLNYRLLALARIWSTVEFFFPHKKSTLTTNWNVVLKNQIPVFENATDSIAYFKAIASTLYELNDSHSAFLIHTNNYHPYGDKVFPYSFMLVDGNLFLKSKYQISVEFSDEDFDKLEYNDMIQSIDGKPVSEMVTDYEKYISGSHKASRDKFVAFEMRRGWNAISEVIVLRNNELKTLRIPRVPSSSSLNFIEDRFKQQKKWSIIDDQVGIIQPREISIKEFDKAFKELKKTKALIIDLRNSINQELSFHFFDDYFSTVRKQFFHYETLSKEIPGRFHQTFDSSFTGKNQKMKYEGKLIFLINENIQSSGETKTATFKTYPNTIFIGSPTAGTNGEATLISLPGGYKFRMTSAKITYMDGNSSVGKGIQPDVFVIPTKDGLLQNQDEVLQKAIDYAKSL